MKAHPKRSSCNSYIIRKLYISSLQRIK